MSVLLAARTRTLRTLRQRRILALRAPLALGFGSFHLARFGVRFRRRGSRCFLDASGLGKILHRVVVLARAPIAAFAVVAPAAQRIHLSRSALTRLATLRVLLAHLATLRLLHPVLFAAFVLQAVLEVTMAAELALLRFRRLALLQRRTAFRRLPIRRIALRLLSLGTATWVVLTAVALLHPLQVTILLGPAIGLLARLVAALPSMSRAALLRSHEPSSS
ncbi:MAG TPA: hypothetical protein VFM89_00295 [Casimicrobiaceae bacterium]|nr:hypothetical protein [Casimicrobiaceae bacterium]